MKTKQELIDMALKRVMAGGSVYCDVCVWLDKKGEETPGFIAMHGKDDKPCVKCGYWDKTIEAGWFRKDFDLDSVSIRLHSTKEGAMNETP